MYSVRLLLLICCIFFPYPELGAQSLNSFTSDRPGLTNTPQVVGKHYLQFQFGGSFGQYTSGRASFYPQTAYDRNSDYFFRFGLSHKTEVNLGFGLAQMRGAALGNYPPFYTEYIHFSHPTRLNNLSVGLRHTFFTEAEKDYALGILVQLNSAYNQSFAGLGEYGYILSLLGSKQIGSRISSSANVGLQHKDAWTGPELFYVVNLAFDLGNNLGLFVETKNEAVLIDQPDLIQWYNSGLYWKLTPNFMLDVYGGYNRAVGSRFNENYWYAAMGLSWKIKAIATRKKVAP